MRKYLVVIFPALLPLAAGAVEINTFFSTTLTDVVKTVINFLLIVASLIFIFGVIKYIQAAEDTEKLEEARRFIIFTLVGLIIIFIFWGLVRVVVTSLQLNNEIPLVPQF